MTLRMPKKKTAPTDGEGVDGTGTSTQFSERMGKGCRGSCCSLTEEEVLLVTPAVSIPLGADAAVVAGTTLEVVAPTAGMLRLTPTAPQTSAAKARVTEERGNVSIGRTKSGIWGRNGLGKEAAGREEGKPTLLVCSGTDFVDQIVQRGHELGVAADTGEVLF